MHPLKKARLDLGYTQTMLADFAQVSVPTIKRAEAGKPLRADMVQLICQYFSSHYHHQVEPKELGLVNEEGREKQGNNELSFTLDDMDLEREEQNLYEETANSSQTLRYPKQTSTIHETAHDSLVAYLQQQRARMLNTLASGSTNLKVKDIVGENGLFISPPWEELQGTANHTDIVQYVIEALTEGQQILLLGSAGQGKTTLLKQVFTLMIDRFLNESTETATPFPMYIPLREFPTFTGNAIELLWNYASEDFPLSFEDFTYLVRNNHIVFLFDGFDEIRGELTQQAINERAMSKVFARPSILSCRKSFFEFYLSMSAIQEYYSQWIELQPLKLNSSITKYITTFCQKKQLKASQKNITTPEKIIEAIRGKQELQDLLQRPLLLLMMLDIFTDPRETSEDQWNPTKLYQKYTEKWLKNEAAKTDSLLKWYEKAMLVQEIAWFTYTAKSTVSSPYNQTVTFTRSDLSHIVKIVAHHYPHLSTAQILEDLCFRTVLAVSEGENYYFLHKSFQEYFVAKYIFERMRVKEPNELTIEAIGTVLQEFLPAEIGTFLKDMLEAKDVSRSEKDLIAENLIKVYQHYKGDDTHAITIRQHASHYLALLRIERATQFLEQAYKQEQNKWIQRGMMVGLALYCKKADVLEEYITMLREDAEAASINLGYYLVYYGDQAQELGYYDQDGERCDGTARAIFRRLKDKHFQSGWSLDILTLSTLLEKRGMIALSSQEHYLPFLKDFLRTDYPELGDTFQREKNHLQAILERGIMSQ